jgi:hypothetical protein
VAKKTKIFLTYLGKTQSAREWGYELGIDPQYIRARHRMGLSIEKILSCKKHIKICKWKRKYNISLEDGIDAWKGIMISRYGKNFASRFRMQSYKNIGEQYRKEVVSMRIAV